MPPLRFSVSVPDPGEARHRLRADGGVRAVETTVRVAAERTGGAGPPGEGTGVVIALDFAPERVEITRRVAAAAIAALPDGTPFALLRGGDNPRICYPYSESEVWAVANGMHRNMAVFEAKWLLPAGRGSEHGTVYTDWLLHAREHFAREPKPISHLIMITDGRGPGGEPDDGLLDHALDACAGDFTCDVLGVGSGWEPQPLTRIATRLHGVAALVEEDDRLGARLDEIVRRLRTARMPAAPVEVWLRAGVRLLSFRESAPVRRDLSPDRRAGGDAERQVFTTHLWDAGIRDYTLTLEAGPDGDPALGLDADPLDADLLLAQVSVADGAAAVRVRWSYGPLPGAYTRAVSRMYRRYDELADAFNEGCKALSRDDPRTALEKLGEAARIAHLIGDHEFLRNELSMIADVLDAERGAVRLREHVDAGEVLRARLTTGQHRVPYDADRDPARGPDRGPERGPALDTAAASSVPCPREGCDRLSTPLARYCVLCGTTLAAGPAGGGT